MRTAASEYLNQTQIMSRLGATFGALIHEQVAAVRRCLDDETSWDSSETMSIAELAIRLVERSAEWLEVQATSGPRSGRRSWRSAASPWTPRSG